MIVVSKASVPRKTKIVTTTSRTPVDSVVVVKATKRNNRRKKRTTIMGLPSQLTNSIGKAYFNCLCDPFSYPPVRLGFGTLVPTTLHTAYLRTSLTTNADGSLVIFALPNQNNLVLTTNSSLTLAPVAGNSTILKSGNYSLLNSLIDTSRTVAMGLRIYPMVPATSVPGIISLGCAPRTDLSDFVAPSSTYSAGTGLANSNTSVVSQMPYLREHMARPSASDFFQVTWRPTDIRDFIFTAGDSSIIDKATSGVNAPFFDVIAQNSSTFIARQDDTQGSFLVATLQGLPATSNVYIEVVLHLECTESCKTISTTTSSDIRIDLNDSLANSGFSSMESFYRSIVNSLPNVDSVAGAASSLLTSPMVRQAASRYIRNNIMGVKASGYSVVERF